MKRFNAMRFFKTEAEARKFAEQVGSDSWGWMKDCKTGKHKLVCGLRFRRD